MLFSVSDCIALAGAVRKQFKLFPPTAAHWHDDARTRLESCCCLSVDARARSIGRGSGVLGRLVMSGVLSLSSWAAWAPGLPDHAAWQMWAEGLREPESVGEPGLPEIPAMMRRRADRLARMTLRAAFDVLGGRVGLPVVYVSRHGSVGRSAELLEALARGDALSPAGFAASVHNAAPGLLGIVRNDPAPYTALAAETGCILAMLAEVQAFLSDGHDEVLAILSDEPVPACYSPYVTEPEVAAAWAGVFRQGSASGFALSQTGAPSSPHAEAEVLAWVRWLLGDELTFDCAPAWQVRRV